MINFKNSLAYRILNFAIKVEKISKEVTKTRSMDNLEEMAKLQGEIERTIDELFEKTTRVERLMKQEKKEN